MAHSVPVEEFRFKSLIKHSMQHRVMFGGIQWRGPPADEYLPQSNQLSDGMYYSADDFLGSLRETWHYCAERPRDHGLDHALIYVFDGRGGCPKFHHYLWKPHMGAALEAVSYRRVKNNHDPLYSPCAFDALMAQKKPVKVSTVTKQALKRVRKVIGVHGSSDMHMANIRVALSVFIRVDPFVHAVRVDNHMNPYGGATMVEHLGIYDKEPTWLKSSGAILQRTDHS